MFDDTQNVAGQFLDSSGSFTFDRSRSTVITVQTNVVISGSTCAFDTYADAAITAASALGYDANNGYDFRLFVIPQQLPCTWGGLAYVGCSSARYCRAFTRFAGGDVSNHEVSRLS